MKSSLVLITIDCMRADHAGWLGYEKPTTPFLDGLAKESIVFEKAVAAGAPTYYSFPSIMAARYPLALGRDVIGLAPGEDSLATGLSREGYQTAAFLAGNPYLSEHFNYHEGFDIFEDFLGGESAIAPGPAVPERRESPADSFRSRMNHVLRGLARKTGPSEAIYNEAYFRYCHRVSLKNQNGNIDGFRRYPDAKQVVNAAIEWLNASAPGPFFLWVHLMDPHHPYFPPREALAAMCTEGLSGARSVYLNSFWNRHDLGADRLDKLRDEVVGLYDAGIRWADAQISRLVDHLRELGKWDETALVATSDHGEEFLEHKGRFHWPWKLTEELVRVPLLLRVPGAVDVRKISSTFSLIDLAPTIVDALGLGSKSIGEGKSCWTDIGAGKTWEYPLITECVRGCTNPWRRETRAGERLMSVRDSRFKLVLNFGEHGEELFDLERDPHEHAPLKGAAHQAVKRELLEVARDHIRRSSSAAERANRFRARLDYAASALRGPKAHGSLLVN